MSLSLKFERLHCKTILLLIIYRNVYSVDFSSRIYFYNVVNECILETFKLNGPKQILRKSIMFLK